MLRYPVPSNHEDHSRWIELSTFDELPPGWQRKTIPTMAQAMANHPMLDIEIHYGVVTQALPYADLLKAFPDVDPAKTYVTIRHRIRPLNG